MEPIAMSTFVKFCPDLKRQERSFGSEELASKSKMFRLSIRTCGTGSEKEWLTKRWNWHKKECYLSLFSYLKTFNELTVFKVDSQVCPPDWFVCSVSDGFSQLLLHCRPVFPRKHHEYLPNLLRKQNTLCPLEVSHLIMVLAYIVNKLTPC